MAVKLYEIENIGTVHVYKRRGTSSMRLSITADGKVRLIIPSWSTYASGLAFARSRELWIRNNRPERREILSHGQHIGKAHKLYFESADIPSPKSRISGSDIRIIRPTRMLSSHPEVQAAAEKACIRALRAEAAKLLPVRLKKLAAEYDFNYSSIQIKQLKGRWGSCDNHQHITLNLFLMQLPWKLIDYVLVHELTHTKHLNHGEGFWNEFLKNEPYAKEYRRQIKKFQPILQATEADKAVA